MTCVDTSQMETIKFSTQLRMVIRQSGVDMTPEDFIRSVGLAYREARRRAGTAGTRPCFSRENSHEVFQRGLMEAKQRLNKSPRILVLGCGEEYVGDDCSYAALIVANLFDVSPTKLIHQMDIRRRDLFQWEADKPGFDLVVSHSLAHFVHDLPLLLRLIAKLVASHGGYLMAHEPNAAYWRSDTLLSVRESFITRRAKQGFLKYVAPNAYVTKIKQIVQPGLSKTVEQNVNDYLTQKYGFRTLLTPRQIACIVDPHRPSELPGDFRIGLDGLDQENMMENGLAAFTPAWQQTYDHLGPVSYSSLSSDWKLLDMRLRSAFPADGCSWTALWMRN